MTTANAEMLAAWDGPEGAHWTAHAEHYERVSADHRAKLITAAAISGTDRVLDIGCGTGDSSRRAARVAATGSVVGLDLSSAMLERARAAAAEQGLTNCSFVQADAQIFAFESGHFDVAISAFGCMFFDDPVAAFANIRSGVRPAGRIALLTWNGMQRNEWIMAIRAAAALGRDLPAPPADLPGPFGLADPQRIRTILREAGYCDVEVTACNEDMVFGTSPEDALAFIRANGPTRAMLADLTDVQQQSALDALRATIDAHTTPRGVCFGSSAWLVTAGTPSH